MQVWHAQRPLFTDSVLAAIFILNVNILFMKGGSGTIKNRMISGASLNRLASSNYKDEIPIEEFVETLVKNAKHDYWYIADYSKKCLKYFEQRNRHDARLIAETKAKS